MHSKSKTSPYSNSKFKRSQARQSLGVGIPPFQPISLTRYSQALGEAQRYAAWLGALRRELQAGQAAVAGECKAEEC